jgi:hypothetical protein
VLDYIFAKQTRVKFAVLDLLQLEDLSGTAVPENTHVALQGERRILQKRSTHPHQVDEESEVSLNNVDANTLSNEGAEPREHLVKPGV